MTTLELKTSLIQEFVELLDNEENVKKLQRYMRRLRQSAKRDSKVTMEEEELKPYTLEELNIRIEKSLADVAAGRVISVQEINKELTQYLARP